MSRKINVPSLWPMLLPLFMTLIGEGVARVPSQCATNMTCIEAEPSCQLSVVFGFRYENASDILHVEIIAEQSNRKYAAVGLSSDVNMGDDSVIDCFDNGQGPMIHLGRTTNFKSHKHITDTDILLNAEGEKNATAISCRADIQLAKANQLGFPIDIYEEYIPLFAVGDVVDGVLTHHDGRCIMGLKIRLMDSARDGNRTPAGVNSSPDVHAATALGPRLTHLHGSAMTIAWMMFVSFAVFSARYRRSDWIENVLGTQMWFTIHRSMNVVALVFIIIGLLAIGYAKDFEWHGPWFGRDIEHNLSVRAIHSLVGLLAAVFAFLQPLNALFRCKPNTPLRPIFNYVHRSFGIFALTLAYTAILLAVLKFRTVFYSYTAAAAAFGVAIFFGLAVLVLGEALRYRAAQRQKRKVKLLERTESGVVTPSSEEPPHHQKDVDEEGNGCLSNCDGIQLAWMGVFMFAVLMLILQLIVPPYK